VTASTWPVATGRGERRGPEQSMVAGDPWGVRGREGVAGPSVSLGIRTGDG
jgi:hypothetical protein